MKRLIPHSEFVEAFYGSERTARRHRALGKGPAFIRIGRRIFYRPEAIEAWLSRHEIDGGFE